MKSSLVLLLALFATLAKAADTTPPTLTITRTWIEKMGTRSNFKMLLDPQDETGFAPIPGTSIQFRSHLNNTAPVAAGTAWNTYPWQRGVPFSIGFTCTACVIEVRAIDAAGNVSPLQRRVFKSPFPYTAAPVTSIRLRDSTGSSFPGPALDCRGLFAGDVDGNGTTNDLLQVDRISGNVTARLQTSFPLTNTVVVNVPTTTITASAAADYDKDGRLDLAMLVNNALRVYHNDGMVSSTLTFTLVTISTPVLNGMSLNAMSELAFCDISGEGRPELIVSGTDGSGNARIGWLDNNNSFTFLSSNSAVAPTGVTAGKVAAGDVNGDGKLDVVMMDATGMQVVVFKNDDGARLGGDDDVVTGKRPVSTAISDGRPDARAAALAVGDVTGDGRADVVVIINWWGSTNFADQNDTHTYQYWQLLDSVGDTGLHAQNMQRYSSGPFSATEDVFASDVIIRDLNGDRFPEVIMTSQFQADLIGTDDPDNHPELIPARGPGIRALQFFPHLNAQNHLTQLDYQAVARVQIASTTNPHRLAAAPFSGNKLPDIWVACDNSTTPFGWVGNSSGSGSTAALAVIGGASTENDPDGSDGPNGSVTYFAYPGSYIDYQLTYINNTTSTLTNATLDCILPKYVTVETLDGGALITASTKQTMRWTLTIAAGETGTKNFRVRAQTNAKVGVLRPQNILKAGTKTASSYMPNIAVDEPISFDLVSVQTDTDTSGRTVHLEEFITYRMRITNKGLVPITDTKISMDMPTGARFDGTFTDPEAPHVLTPGDKHIDWTVLNVNPGAWKEVICNVEVRAAPPAVIKHSTMTALRPSGLKKTIPTFETEVRQPLKITASSNKPNGASPGEEIEYTLTVENCSVNSANSCKVVALIPPGTNLVSARANNGSDNYTDSPLPIAALSETSAPGYFYDFGKLKRLLQWDLGTIPGAPLRSGPRPRRTLMFTVKVGADAPTFWTPGGEPTPIYAALENFNATFTLGSATRYYAYPRVNSSSYLNPFNLLPKEPADEGMKVEVNDINPQPKPSLQLTKSVRGPRNYSLPEVPDDGDPNTLVYPVQPRESGAGDTPFTVLKNGNLTYCLHYANYGNVTAHAVRVHDELPYGMVFQGFVAKDRKLVQSVAFSRFYDGNGGILPPGTETYTDSNGNSAFDPGEPFTDTNGNGLLDEIAPDITKIRSFDLYAGDVPAGESHRFFYEVKCTLNAGNTSTSLYGGVAGVTNGLNYTFYSGYYLTCDDLYFPVNGGPEGVRVLVVNPARPQFVLRNGYIGAAEASASPTTTLAAPRGKSSRSVTAASPTNTFSAAMPVDIRGNGSFSDMKLTMDIPAGYVVQNAVVKDKTGANVINWNATPTPAQKLTDIWADKAGGKGPCRVTYPLGTRTFCWPIIKLAFDPAVLADPAPNILQDKDGQTKQPLLIKCIVSGTNLATQTNQIQMDARMDVTGESKAFIGRAARMSVTREGEITYYIFYGNLGDEMLGREVEMKVPEGCDFVSCSTEASNTHISPFEFSSTDLDKGSYNATTRKVTWGYGPLFAKEGVVVTLTVKVRKDFAGIRIDDDSCRLKIGLGKTVIKSPGPLAVAIRTGDIKTQEAELTQRWLQGALMKNNDATVATLKSNFSLGLDSYGITIGGADYLQMQNGMVIIPLGNNRVMILDDNTKGILSHSETVLRNLAQTTGFRIYVGAGGPNGTISGLGLSNVPGYPAGEITPNKVLRDLDTADSLIKKGLADIVCGGGLNLIEPGSADFTELPPLSSSNPKFIIPRPDVAVPIPEVRPLANLGALKPGQNVYGVVKAGNGNGVRGIGPPGSAGMVLAGGAAGLIGHDGSTLIGHDGSTLIGHDGSTLVGEDGASLIGHDGSTVVANDGAGVVANDGAGILNQDAATVIGQSGSAIVAGGGLNNNASIVAGGGGNVIGQSGSAIVAGGGGN